MKFNTKNATKNILGGTLLAAVTALAATAPAEAIGLGQKVNNVYEYDGKSYDAQIVEGTFNQIFNSGYKDGLLQFRGSHNGAVGAAEALAEWAVNNNYDMLETRSNWDGGRHWNSPATIWNYNSSHWQAKVGRDNDKDGTFGHYYTGSRNWTKRNKVARFAVWSESAAPTEEVPEPLTILGSGLALGFGAMFKKKQSNKG